MNDPEEHPFAITFQVALGIAVGCGIVIALAYLVENL